MARQSRANYLKKSSADAAAATLASAENPDGTAYTLPVEGTVTATPGAGAANIANGQATAGAASGALVAARATRRSVSVRNTHAAESIYIGAGVVSAANGFLLKAGESIPLFTRAAINGIRAGAVDVTVCFLEEYD